MKENDILKAIQRCCKSTKDSHRIKSKRNSSDNEKNGELNRSKSRKLECSASTSWESDDTDILESN